MKVGHDIEEDLTELIDKAEGTNLNVRGFKKAIHHYTPNGSGNPLPTIQPNEILDNLEIAIDLLSREMTTVHTQTRYEIQLSELKASLSKEYEKRSGVKCATDEESIFENGFYDVPSEQKGLAHYEALVGEFTEGFNEEKPTRRSINDIKKRVKKHLDRFKKTRSVIFELDQLWDAANSYIADVRSTLFADTPSVAVLVEGLESEETAQKDMNGKIKPYELVKDVIQKYQGKI